MDQTLTSRRSEGKTVCLSSVVFLSSLLCKQQQQDRQAAQKSERDGKRQSEMRVERSETRHERVQKVVDRCFTSEMIIKRARY